MNGISTENSSSSHDNEKTMPGGDKVTLDDPVLRSGVTIYTGATDRAGRPLITFPTRCQLKLHNPQTCAQIPAIILYYMSNTRGTPKRSGWSFLADFRCSTKEAIMATVQILDTLQETSRGCVTVFYCVQPKQKALQKKLRKLVGLKLSKKNPKIAVYKTVIFSEPTELHQVMDMTHVTADFGGTLQYNHEAWINFKKATDLVMEAVETTVRGIPAAVDRVTMLQEYDIPSSQGDLNTLIEKLRDKYHTIVRDLKIEVVIDQCKSLHEKLSNPQDYTNFTDMSHLPMFSHVLQQVNSHQKALVNGRMELQSLWRTAESRLAQSFQLEKYKDKAHKVLSWIRQVGLPVANEEAQVADSLSQAQVNKAYYEAGFLTVSKNVLALANRIQKKLETMVIESSQEHRKEALEINRKLTTNVEQFKAVVEKTRQVYDKVYNFHLLTAKVCNWYRRTLQFLPTHLLRKTPSTSRLARQDRVFPSSRLMTPQWQVTVSHFVSTNTPPRSNYLQGIREGIPLIKDTWTRSQARLLIHRVSVLRRLLMCPDLVSNVELTEVMRWKETAIYGYDDLDFSVAVTGIEQVADTHLHPSQLQRQSSKNSARPPHTDSWTESSESIDTDQLKRGTAPSRHFVSKNTLPAGVAVNNAPHSTQTLPTRRQSSSSRLQKYKQHKVDQNLLQKHKSMGAIDSLDGHKAKAPQRSRSGYLPASHEHSYGIHGDSEGSDSENLQSNRSSDERYVSLSYQNSPDCAPLPAGLQHLDLQAFQYNHPQGGALSSINSPYEQQRSHRQGSVTDSGLGAARSGTDMSRLSLSTPGNSPQHTDDVSLTRTNQISPIQGAKSLPDINESKTSQLCHADLENIAKSNLDPQVKMKLMASMIENSSPGVVLQQTNGGFETTGGTPLAAYSLADISSGLHSTLKVRPVQQSTPNLKMRFQSTPHGGARPRHPVTFSSMQQLSGPLDSPELLRDAAHSEINVSRRINPDSIIKLDGNKDKSINSPVVSPKLKNSECSPAYNQNMKQMLIASTDDDNDGLYQQGTSVEMIQAEDLGDAEVDMGEFGVDIEAWLDGRQVNPAVRTADIHVSEVEEDIATLQRFVLQRKRNESELLKVKQRLTDIEIDNEANKQDQVAQSLRHTDFILKEQEELHDQLKADERPALTYDVFSSLPVQHQAACISSNESETSSLIDHVVNSFDSAMDQKVAAPGAGKVQTRSEESGYSSRASVADRRQHMMEVFKSRLHDKEMADEGTQINNGHTVGSVPSGSGEEGAVGGDFSYNQQITNNPHPVPNKTNRTRTEQGTEANVVESKSLASSRSPSLSPAGSLSSHHGNSTSFDSESCAEGERSEVDEGGSEVKGDGVQVMGSHPPACERSPIMHASSFYIESLKTPVIIDNGSGMCKCGIADQAQPCAVFPAFVGKAKYDEIGTSNHVDVYVGQAAQSMRGVLKLNYPLKHGIVTDWEAMEKIWEHAFFDQLRIMPDEHPVLLTEAPLNPMRNRERMVEMMFETFQVPAVYVAVQAVLALMATGKTTGIVLDSGDGVTHIVPVYEGCTLNHLVTRLDLAGRDLTQYMVKLLQQAGHSFTTTAEHEIVRDIKEQLCYVTDDYEAEMKRAAVSPDYETAYTLPDGRDIWVNTEKFRCPEALFDPSVLGREHAGIHQVIYDVIKKCDIDIRQELLNNILLSGGTTMFPGLAKRLKSELDKLTNKEDTVNIISLEDRQKHLVWQGGALLTNLPNFAGVWITREEYQEFGAAIVHRKCL